MEQLKDAFVPSQTYGMSPSKYMQQWADYYRNSLINNPNVWRITLKELLCACELYGDLMGVINAATAAGIYLQLIDADVSIEYGEAKPLPDGLITVDVTFNPKPNNQMYVEKIVPKDAIKGPVDIDFEFIDGKPQVKMTPVIVGIDPAVPGRDQIERAFRDATRDDGLRFEIVDLDQLNPKADPQEESIKNLKILLDGHSVIDKDFLEMTRVLEQPAAPEQPESKGPRQQSKYKRGKWWNK